MNNVLATKIFKSKQVMYITPLLTRGIVYTQIYALGHLSKQSPNSNRKVSKWGHPSTKNFILVRRPTLIKKTSIEN